MAKIYQQQLGKTLWSITGDRVAERVPEGRRKAGAWTPQAWTPQA